MKGKASGDQRRSPPLRIPLTFDDAVDGLLRVSPKKLAARKPAKKRPKKK
jgi:hypothetical protein